MLPLPVYRSVPRQCLLACRLNSSEDWDVATPQCLEDNPTIEDNEHAESPVSDVSVAALEGEARHAHRFSPSTPDEPQSQSQNDDLADPGLELRDSWGVIARADSVGTLYPWIPSPPVLHPPIDSQQPQVGEGCHWSPGSIITVQGPLQPAEAPVDNFSLSEDARTDDQSEEDNDWVSFESSVRSSLNRAPSTLEQQQRIIFHDDPPPEDAFPRVDSGLSTKLFASKKSWRPDRTDKPLESESSEEITAVPLKRRATPHPSEARPMENAATFQPYVNLVHAAGLPHTLKKEKGDGWDPVWTVFPLKVFRGSAYKFVKIQSDWDDEALLSELRKAYDELRTVWRKWFSLRSVASVFIQTMLPVLPLTSYVWHRSISMVMVGLSLGFCTM